MGTGIGMEFMPMGGIIGICIGEAVFMEDSSDRAVI